MRRLALGLMPWYQATGRSSFHISSASTRGLRSHSLRAISPPGLLGIRGLSNTRFSTLGASPLYSASSAGSTSSPLRPPKTHPFLKTKPSDLLKSSSTLVIHLVTLDFLFDLRQPARSQPLNRLPSTPCQLPPVSPSLRFRLLQKQNSRLTITGHTE